MDKEIIVHLTEQGLTHNQAIVYMLVLSHPGIRAGVIISTTHLSRSVVYECVKELESLGLIKSNTQSSVIEYRATSTENLVRLQENRLQQARQTADALSRFNIAYNQDDMMVYRNTDAISFVCDQHFETPNLSEVLFFGSSKFGNQAQLGGYWNRYHKRRTELGIDSRILYDRSTSADIVSKRNGLPGCEARYLPFGNGIPVWWCIWGANVAQFVPIEQVVYITKNKSVADGMRQYFDFIWEQSSRYLEH
jgi:DNA-binding MarR family transcriptional regulator